MGSFDFWDSASQEDLLAEAQRNPSGGAMTALVRRFEPLVRKIARSMSVCPMTRDDLMNEARLALILAVQRHKLGQAGFAAYAELTMKGAASRWLRRWTDRSADDLEAIEEPAGPESITTNWGDGKVADLVNRLPCRQRDLLTLRYIEDAELTTIARVRAVTESAISQQLRTINRMLVVGLAA